MFSLDPGSGRGAYGCVFMDNKAVGLIQLFKHGHTHIYIYIYVYKIYDSDSIGVFYEFIKWVCRCLLSLCYFGLSPPSPIWHGKLKL